MASIKKRNKWTRPVSFDPGTPVRKLADYIAPSAPENWKPAKAVELCSPTMSFDEALSQLIDGLPDNGPVDDLTDAERAFCAGWAYLARQQFGGNGQEICAAIRQHIDNHDKPRLLGEDDDDVHALNG